MGLCRLQKSDEAPHSRHLKVELAEQGNADGKEKVRGLITELLRMDVDGRPQQEVGTVDYSAKEPDEDYLAQLDQKLRQHVPLLVHDHESVPQRGHADRIQHLV